MVVLLLLVVAVGYGYFRYQWGKVASSPCTTCVAVPAGQPYNVLLIGSDSRAGETAAEAQQFGSAASCLGSTERHHKDRPGGSGERHRLVALHSP